MINWYAELSEELDNLDKENLTKDEIKKVMNKLKDKEEYRGTDKRIQILENKVAQLWVDFEDRTAGQPVRRLRILDEINKIDWLRR